MTKLKATVTFDLDFSGLLTQEQVDSVTKRLQEGSVGTPIWEGCKQAAGGDTEKFLELVSRTWARREIRKSFNVPAKVTFHKEQPKPVRPTLPEDWWVRVSTREEILEVLTLLQGNYRWRSGREALEHVPTDCIALGVYQGVILYQFEDMYGPDSFHDDGCTGEGTEDAIAGEETPLGRRGAGRHLTGEQAEVSDSCQQLTIAGWVEAIQAADHDGEGLPACGECGSVCGGVDAVGAAGHDDPLSMGQIGGEFARDVLAVTSGGAGSGDRDAIVQRRGEVGDSASQP